MMVIQAAVAQHDYLPRTIATLRTASIPALILLIPHNIEFDVLIRHTAHTWPDTVCTAPGLAPWM